jgi:hypothetical protein
MQYDRDDVKLTRTENPKKLGKVVDKISTEVIHTIISSNNV